MFNGWKITNILDVGLCELAAEKPEELLANINRNDEPGE